MERGRVRACMSSSEGSGTSCDGGSVAQRAQGCRGGVRLARLWRRRPHHQLTCTSKPSVAHGSASGPLAGLPFCRSAATASAALHAASCCRHGGERAGGGAVCRGAGTGAAAGGMHTLAPTLAAHPTQGAAHPPSPTPIPRHTRIHTHTHPHPHTHPPTQHIHTHT